MRDLEGQATYKEFEGEATFMKDFKGKKIAITRPIERSQEAIKIIEEYGGEVLVAPTLELVITNTQPLKDLCRNVDELDWLIFTSPTSILSLFKHCKNLKDRLNTKCKIAVIGPRTANYLAEYGLEADLIPTEYTAEGLLELFEDIDIKGFITPFSAALVAVLLWQGALQKVLDYRALAVLCR